MNRSSLAWELLTAGVLAGWATALPASAEEPVRLREAFPVGHRYHVRTRVDLSGTLTPPAARGKPAPRPITLKGNSAIEYDERVLEVNGQGEVGKSLRVYRRMDFHRTVGGQPQQTSLRPAVRRLVLLRHKNTEVPFSPDGPLTWGEIDQVRTDVFTPALAGLLPDRAVRAGDTWEASAGAVQELTDMERVDEGKLECRLEGVAEQDGRRQARVSFRGTVRGTNEDGPSRQKLDGYFLFDLGSNHLSYLYLRGVHSLLEKDGREVGRIEGRFVLSRQVPGRSAELDDAALRGLVLEPNDDNTRLLYDNTALGVRFLYPRRWKVAQVGGNQVALDGADGTGLLLTVEPPARVPTGAQFLDESRRELDRQKVRLVRTEGPRRLDAEGAVLEHFSLGCEAGRQTILMDYYVTRQRTGGVTVAARLLPRDLSAARKEVERLARSVEVTRR